MQMQATLENFVDGKSNLLIAPTEAELFITATTHSLATHFSTGIHL
jgi:hypothetical protein